jgi:hypothetical protein
VHYRRHEGHLPAHARQHGSVGSTAAHLVQRLPALGRCRPRRADSPLRRRSASAGMAPAPRLPAMRQPRDGLRRRPTTHWRASLKCPPERQHQSSRIARARPACAANTCQACRIRLLSRDMTAAPIDLGRSGGAVEELDRRYEIRAYSPPPDQHGWRSYRRRRNLWAQPFRLERLRHNLTRRLSRDTARRLSLSSPPGSPVPTPPFGADGAARAGTRRCDRQCQRQAG